MHLVFATVKSCGKSEMLVGCLRLETDLWPDQWNHKQRPELVNEMRLTHQCYRTIAGVVIILIIVLSGNFSVLLILLFFNTNINFSDEKRILSP